MPTEKKMSSPKILSEPESVNSLKRDRKQLTKQVSRFEEEILRLTTETQRLTVELAIRSQGSLAITRANLREAEIALKTIARMRGPLKLRPVDWYLGQEACTRAERYFRERGTFT